MTCFRLSLLLVSSFFAFMQSESNSGILSGLYSKITIDCVIPLFSAMTQFSLICPRPISGIPIYRLIKFHVLESIQYMGVLKSHTHSMLVAQVVYVQDRTSSTL